jgi:hypothetical protein
MSLCYAEHKLGDWPVESRLLDEVVVRLVEGEAERRRHDELLEREHYLRNANAIGRVVRYGAEDRGEWVAVLTFCSAALHLKPRDRFLNWSARQVRERRHLIAQNSRFLVLPATGRWPNLASRVLKLACARLAQDWQNQFRQPVLLVETFVDPQRFRGTCYRAANWQALGRTRGFERCGQDFYLDTQHPKELWVYPLGRQALNELRAPVLAEALREGGRPLPPPVPVKTGPMTSLASFLRQHVRDPRDPPGVRHSIVSVVAMATLAIAAGCQGPHAIAEFAQSLNHGQRRRLGCRPKRGARRQFDVPCERTFYRLFEGIDPDQLCQTYAAWMTSLDPKPLTVLHLDGKGLRNADPAPARLSKAPGPSGSGTGHPGRPAKAQSRQRADVGQLSDAATAPGGSDCGAAGHQRRGGRRGASAANGPAGGPGDRGRGAHHPSQWPALDPGTGGRLPVLPQRQPTRRTRQSPTTARGQYPPLRPSRRISTMGGPKPSSTTDATTRSGKTTVRFATAPRPGIFR